jgi:hypothetical protein
MGAAAIALALQNKPRHCEEGEARRGNPWRDHALHDNGLLRRYAPRNDEGGLNVSVCTITPE